MKRLILLATILFVVSSSYGANKMSMVTYFPVPYVAYSQVSADQQLDVGLTSACNMNLGCSESDVNLKAHTVNLQKGKLELNNGKGVFGQSISLGNGNGTGQVRFNNVRMKGGEMQSLNAESMNVQTLELFGKPFPACKGKSGSDGQMKWQELALQGYSGTDSRGELYLVCGGTENATGCPADKQPTRGQTYQEDCSGSTQKITYTWDSSSCEYKASGTCPTKKKVCLIFADCTSWWVRTNPFSVNQESCSFLDTQSSSTQHALESLLRPWLEQQGYKFASCNDGKPCEAPAEISAGTSVLSDGSGQYGIWSTPCKNNGELLYVQAQRFNTMEVAESETCPPAGSAKECSSW